MDFAKTARNVAIARVAWAFARDRLAAQLPGVEPRKQRSRAKTLLIGGGIAAVLGAALFKKREAVRALLPGGDDSSAPPRPETYTPPPVSNYDASGPVANTATSVPVPPAYESSAIDEAEEEAAAAAEAANIGGPPPDYAGEPRRKSARWPRPAKVFPRARSRPRPTWPSPAPAVSDEQRQVEEQANPVTPENADAPTDPEWKTWSGRAVDS